MQTCQWKITGVVIEIVEVVMGLYVTRIAFQRLSKILERTDGLTAIQLDDSQIAIGFRYVIAGIDCLDIKLTRLLIALLVQQESFFKRSQQPGDLHLSH